ncbi:ABC transporter ATP-binding protein [Natronomonas sp. F2-12]|jgi:peptide/nickel transport system ATP-binding protein|uniref:ABC transporter ATP-binding protein n=1 Tax=Natronomonas aquatica TaxID=2841590 RepID=A0A9R1D6J7_9EURY|nr:ABC transporter ATP-binding protein [Natronomonas aquatica]MCQ4332125.1 ABC transporter ATP-binding protein [Natronomonas aquatica]
MTERGGPAGSGEPLLSVRDLEKHYPIEEGFLSRRVGTTRAVDGISFEIYPGETLGLVGESGCGKSTAARSIVRLDEPTGGEVIFNGDGRGRAERNDDGTHPNDVTRFDRAELKAFRRDVQMIFQDPASSFDPRMTVGSAVAELLSVHGMTDGRRRRGIVENLLERVGLSATDYDRYPHEFSGGQKQRVALARALVLNPDLVIADEPVSALDMSVQAEVLSLIEELQATFGLSLLFISHDMSVIERICDRVAVMYLGELVEVGPVEEIFAEPQHPYTEALLSSVPTPDPRAERERIELSGAVPDPADPPDGCRFHTRCHRVIQPEGIDLEQPVWRRLLDFRELVVSGAIDIESLRDRAATDAAPEEGDPVAEGAVSVAERIRDEFDLPRRLSDPTAERALGDAIGELLEGDTEAAAERLASVIVTPCETTVPGWTDHGNGHRSSCLRHRPEGRPIAPDPATDDR